MVWFLFGRKKDTELDKKLRSIENKTIDSFNNVKDNFQNIKSWLTHLNEKDTELDKKLHHILGKLDVIEKYLYKNQQDYDENVEEDLPLKTISLKNNSLDSLTPTQKQMLGLVIRLMRERGLDWVYAKDIAEELYHDQEYAEVRSTMSEYLRFLEDEGLIKRRRRGKQIQVTLTDSGKTLKIFQKSIIQLKKKKRH
ncbi:winged helix-turn-helix transcriptional regulator [Candidatus Woesearchaeota archaeon]|nr:winged helix-turn-helix transcriptional regulator [Candidatus Woesearchaeota archaeon]